MVKKHDEKIRVIFVYTNLGIGGIAKSLITVLHMIDYSKYDVTLYIRRDDVIDLVDEVPTEVHTVLVKNEVKKRVFENNIKGRIVKRIYDLLMKRHKHLAKQFFIRYKYPIQRKKEEAALREKGLKWDVAISFSTDEDDPVFVLDSVVAVKKYVFVRQSTKIAKRNIKALRSFSRIITINPLLVPWVESFSKPRNSVYCLENYVDYESIINLSSEKAINRSNNFVLATCGRLCETKGFECVIQSSKALKDQGIAFNWYWIGDGPERKRMEQMIALNQLEEEIFITGFQMNPYPYINACDIYVQPSIAEAYGRTIAEALVLKKPVISTKTAGGRYILEKYGCGYLVDNCIEDITNTIFELYNHPEQIVNEKMKVSTIDWEQEKNRFNSQWEDVLNGEI